MEAAGPTVARNCPNATPKIGPILETGQFRVQVGWSHQNDTVAGLKTGIIWGWTCNGGDKFQVYDTDDNRSPFACDPVFCGPANFSMIRMFHPYWTAAGIPQDMDSADKARCRKLYHQLVRPYELARRERELDGDYSGSGDEDGDAYFLNKRQTAVERRRKKIKEERRVRKWLARVARAQNETDKEIAREEKERNEIMQSAAKKENAERKVGVPEGSLGEPSERGEQIRDSSLEILEVRERIANSREDVPESSGNESALDAR